MIKDLIIKEKVIRQELMLLGVLFVFSNLTNVYAILVHQGSWSELISQFHVVGLLTLFLYAVSLLLRGLFYSGRAVWRLTTKGTQS
ncbi:MAG: hypothetical protein JJU41_12320 [Bacteroidetes bacterium]|nr:hypothetical protein [Bacteroidota bacterium]MCH8525221.1 hypothetical protein [Balneolales bacterium]